MLETLGLDWVLKQLRREVALLLVDVGWHGMIVRGEELTQRRKMARADRLHLGERAILLWDERIRLLEVQREQVVSFEHRVLEVRPLRREKVAVATAGGDTLLDGAEGLKAGAVFELDEPLDLTLVLKDRFVQPERTLVCPFTAEQVNEKILEELFLRGALLQLIAESIVVVVAAQQGSE